MTSSTLVSIECMNGPWTRLADLYTAPDSQDFTETLKQVQEWLPVAPVPTEPRIREGEESVFGATAIVFGVPVEICGDLFVPHGVPAGTPVEVAASSDGYQHWLAFMLVTLYHRLNVTDLANLGKSVRLFIFVMAASGPGCSGTFSRRTRFGCHSMDVRCVRMSIIVGFGTWTDPMFS
jgi:hypothetical protein